ncbi:Mediator of RNA polymerase II transcription subunit 5 [Neolecta irregularis DAH-3]|uniref:Mediator of RNA polymerase II transcription subunit 5 n=1 Tax=Neolecta irregularis (strain DAH-3) TaxID=1198029 RepID=A0A1U7LTD0_NEOID|nr:Mediator of RNA polymerase II transcription subunit 5 [Neolecta irregularis DAH-3]|eukprot:OLL25904.1 Mediator of RNA polymerase II transcription subunit 5 [Neolecta irregularis DAH-3]
MEGMSILEIVLEKCLARRISPEKWEQLTREAIISYSLEGEFAGILASPPASAESHPLYTKYIIKALETQLTTPLELLQSPPESSRQITHLKILNQFAQIWDPLQTDEPLKLLESLENILEHSVDENLGRLCISIFRNICGSAVHFIAQMKALRNSRNADWTRMERAYNTLGSSLENINIADAQELRTIWIEIFEQESIAMLIPETSENGTRFGRALLVIYFSSLIDHHNLSANDEIFTRLRNIYKVNHEKLLSDLLTSAFDILALSIRRGDTPPTKIFAVRAFLVSKVPSLLSQLLAQGLFCTSQDILNGILMALHHAHMGALSQMPLVDEDLLAEVDVRAELLGSLCTHGLLDPTSAGGFPGIIFEGTFSPRLLMNDLVQDVTDGGLDVFTLILGLEKADGNQDVVSEAIIEIIIKLSNQGNATLLSALCSALIPKLSLVEIIFQYCNPMNLLGPLSDFLDDYKIDEDQECQTLFEEFGGVFLFVLSCLQHYELENSMEQHYCSKGSTFIVSYFREKAVPKSVREFKEEEKILLSKWIVGLFDSEGISDDLLRSSPPQKSILLSPTIFAQAVQAAINGIVSIDTLKEGLEYFLQPFLLPCLVGSVEYICNSLAASRDPKSLAVRLTVLQTLLVPTTDTTSVFVSAVQALLSEKVEYTLRATEATSTDINVEDIISLLQGQRRPKRGPIANGHMLSLREMILRLSEWLNSVLSSHAVDLSTHVTPQLPIFDLRVPSEIYRNFDFRILISTILSELAKCERLGYGEEAICIATGIITDALSSSSSLVVRNWLEKILDNYVSGSDSYPSKKLMFLLCRQFDYQRDFIEMVQMG